MLRPTFVLIFATALGLAETHSLTLRQAVEIALKENPDLVLSRLDEQKAQAGIRVAKDPFVPKVYAGSGDAKTWGYPGSIEGAAPSIIQARTDMALFNVRRATSWLACGRMRAARRSEFNRRATKRRIKPHPLSSIPSRFVVACNPCAWKWRAWSA